MSTTTATAKTGSPKHTAARSKAAAKTKASPAHLARPVTTLAKKMPDYLGHKKKPKRIVAKVDVGWGNTVHLRGEGGGLRWDIGVPMVPIADNQWVFVCFEDDLPREIKFLRNDTDWALGENHVVVIEDNPEFVPQFPQT